jgi:hypothetical protein
MSSNASDQENIENKVQFEEDSTYPLNNNILYRKRMNKITKCSFNYIIIKEGVYLNGIESKSEKTINTNKRSYKIPHGYVVETTWGRAAKKRTVRCEIDFINHITPQFCIKYGSSFQHVVSSTKTTTDVAIKYKQASTLIRTIFYYYIRLYELPFKLNYLF